MNQLAHFIFALVRALCMPRWMLAAENLALRQQLLVLRRQRPARQRLRRFDRVFWVWLARLWCDRPARHVLRWS
jgi:hypothetical protein